MGSHSTAVRFVPVWAQSDGLPLRVIELTRCMEMGDEVGVAEKVTYG